MERPAWNLLAGTLTKYVLLLVNIVLGILLLPFTMHHLGRADYGLWMLAASMTAYLQLFDLGYGNGLVRQVTQADTRGDEDEINVILSTFVVVYTAIGLAALSGVAALVVFVIPRFPNLSPADITTAQWVLAILGLRTAIAFPMSVFGAVTTARQRFVLTGWISIVFALLQGAATYVVLRAGYGLITLVSVSTLIGIVSYAAYVAAARSTFPGMRLSVFRFSRRQVREVTAFSLYLFFISIALQLGYNIDNVVIAAFAGTSAVAVYAVAFRLADYQRQLCNQFNGLLFPVVVRLSAADEMGGLRATLIDGSRIALGMVVGVTACLVAFGDRLVVLWMGPDFLESLAPLYVLALAGVVLVATGPLGNLLLARGRHRLVAFSCLGEAVANLSLSIWLVYTYGIIGAALGTAISVTVSNLVILMPAACRMLEVPVARFLGQTGAPALAALAATVPAAILLRMTFELMSLAHVAAAGTVLGLVYVVAFFGIGLSRTERARYVESVRELSTTALRTGIATP